MLPFPPPSPRLCVIEMSSNYGSINSFRKPRTLSSPSTPSRRPLAPPTSFPSPRPHPHSHLLPIQNPLDSKTSILGRCGTLGLVLTTVTFCLLVLPSAIVTYPGSMSWVRQRGEVVRGVSATSVSWSERATAKALYHIPTQLTTFHSSLRSLPPPSSHPHRLTPIVSPPLSILFP